MNYVSKTLLLLFICYGASASFLSHAMNTAILLAKRGSKLGLFWCKEKAYCAIRINNSTQNPWPNHSVEKKFFDRYRAEVRNVNEKQNYRDFGRLHELYRLYDKSRYRNVLLTWHRLQSCQQASCTMPTSLNEFCEKTEQEEYSAYCFLQHSASLYFFNGLMIASNNNVGDFYGAAPVDSKIVKKWLRPQSEPYLHKQIEKYIKHMCDIP